jgi:hypothetical protein
MGAAFLGRVQPTEIPEIGCRAHSQIDGYTPETVHPTCGET